MYTYSHACTIAHAHTHKYKCAHAHTCNTHPPGFNCSALMWWGHCCSGCGRRRMPSGKAVPLQPLEFYPSPSTYILFPPFSPVPTPTTPPPFLLSDADCPPASLDGGHQALSCPQQDWPADYRAEIHPHRGLLSPAASPGAGVPMLGWRPPTLLALVARVASE